MNIQDKYLKILHKFPKWFENGYLGKFWPVVLKKDYSIWPKLLLNVKIEDIDLKDLCWFLLINVVFSYVSNYVCVSSYTSLCLHVSDWEYCLRSCCICFILFFILIYSFANFFLKERLVICSPSDEWKDQLINAVFPGNHEKFLSLWRGLIQFSNYRAKISKLWKLLYTLTHGVHRKVIHT